MAVEKLTIVIREFGTKLPNVFREYDERNAAAVRDIERSQPERAKRLAALEERVLNLETRRGSGSR